MRTRRAIAAGMLTVAVSLVSVPAAQQAPRDTGLIIGRVLDGDSNAPVTSVIVTLGGGGMRPKRVLVDGQGRFMFAELPAGSFTIDAARTGFLHGTYGRVRADGAGRPLDLAPGERVTDAVIRLWRFATISGSVIDDAGDPVMGARVQALSRTVVSGQWKFVSTGLGGSADDRGNYRITGLMPGTYTLVITSMNSTLPTSLLSAADAERRSPGGLLTDLQSRGTAGFANDMMQGFGSVRIGEFVVQTSADRIAPIVEGRPIEAYPTTWYPRALTADEAGSVTVQAGDDRRGVDLHPILTRTYRVSGTVTGPEGPIGHLALRLVPLGTSAAAGEVPSSLALSLTTAMTATDVNGAFTFLIVPPGQYLIRAVTTPRAVPEPPQTMTVLQTADGMASGIATASLPPMVSTDPTLWAAVPVTVGGEDAAGVRVVLRPGLRVTGRVEFEGNTPKPDGRALRTIRLTMDQADGRTVASPSSYQAQIDPNGRFYTIGLMAGQYVLRADGVPRGWHLKSALAGGRDISNIPIALEDNDVEGLVLTFTDRPTALGGSVKDAQGRPDPNATVLVFPSDGAWTNRGPNPRSLRSIRTSRTGDYSIVNLPPGAYSVVAVSDMVAANWQDPAFLQRVARIATRVTLAEGQSMSTALTTIERIDR